MFVLPCELVGKVFCFDTGTILYRSDDMLGASGFGYKCSIASTVYECCSDLFKCISNDTQNL